MIRVRLLVDGHVQGVGYRTFVKLVARKMKIGGIVRNLPDGKVEIICECRNHEQLNKFMKNIMLSSSENDFISPNVTSIQKVEEKIIEEPEYPIFDINYGNIDEAQKEIITKLDMGSIVIKAMNKDMNDRFNDLDRKYGEIGERLKEISEQFTRLVDFLIKSQQNKN